MKKLLFSLFIIFCSFLYSQVSTEIAYQAVVRNSSQQLVSNANVKIRISILQGAFNGPVIYSETHTAQTNVNGLFNINIGGGTLISGDYNSINWYNMHFLKTEIDPYGGNNYTISSVTRFLSVPYANYAGAAGNGFMGPATRFIGTYSGYSNDSDFVPCTITYVSPNYVDISLGFDFFIAKVQGNTLSLIFDSTCDDCEGSGYIVGNELSINFTFSDGDEQYTYSYILQKIE